MRRLRGWRLLDTHFTEGLTVTTSPSKQAKAEQRRAHAQAVALAARRQQRRQRVTKWVVALTAAGVVLGGLYAIFSADTKSAATAARPGDYAVASPGPNQPAPDFTLLATTGKKVALSAFRGRTVLLFFHEGLGCQPCWDQIGDLERQSPKLDAAGIDQLVTITSAPVDLLAQKMRDDGLTALALSDPDLSVIGKYGANKFGMMGTSRAGHTFVLVNGGGKIVWRADYGGAPDYTMYVPVDKVLADLKAGRAAA